MVYPHKKYDQIRKRGKPCYQAILYTLNGFLAALKKKKQKPSINAICLADLLVSLGSPRAMETLSVLPDGLSTRKSESPAEKVRVRVPPPPHPSFFTVTVILKGSTEKTRCRNSF